MYNNFVTSGDFLNMVLATSIIVIAVSWIVIALFVIKALKAATRLINKAEEKTEEIKLLQNQFKTKLLTSLIAIGANLIARLIKKRR